MTRSLCARTISSKSLSVPSGTVAVATRDGVRGWRLGDGTATRMGGDDTLATDTDTSALRASDRGGVDACCRSGLRRRTGDPKVPRLDTRAARTLELAVVLVRRLPSVNER